MSVLAGVVLFGLVLMLVSLGLAARAHHWARLAERSRIGAQSESQVQQALRTLEREGWQVRHSLPWQGRGDIDSVAIAPTGVAFAIETKTKRVELEHLARVRQMALWLCNRHRRWCPRGAFPVICVVQASRLERTDADVLLISIDRLLPALRTVAGTRVRPAFLSPTLSGRL